MYNPHYNPPHDKAYAMPTKDEMLHALGYNIPARNRAGQIVKEPNDTLPGALRGLWDTGAGALRGATATALGAPADALNMGKAAQSWLSGKENNPETNIPYGSEYFKSKLPSAGTSHEAKIAEELGSYVPLPSQAFTTPVKLVAKGAKALAPTAERMAYELAQKANPAMYVVKPKGGNWLNPSVPNMVQDFKSLSAPSQHSFDRFEQMVATGNMTPARLEALKRSAAGREPLNKWVDTKLSNYIKNEMGTPEDPIRKLAEEGVHHMPLSRELNHSDVDVAIKEARQEAGFPIKGMGQSDLAKQWENLSDESIRTVTPNEMKDHGIFERRLEANPWLEKIDPNTPAHYVLPISHTHLGFDSIVDTLQKGIASGKISPEDLSKITVADAVKRTHEANAAEIEAARQREIAAGANMPVHKVYDTGHKWVELKSPGDFARESDKMDHSVRGYEPTKTDHPEDWVPESKGGWPTYGLGGWDAIKSGKAKVLSLRDADNASHATIEVHNSNNVVYDSSRIPFSTKEALSDEAWEDALASGHRMNSRAFDNAYNDAIMQKHEDWLRANTIPVKDITQIKGHHNGKITPENRAFVKDFLNSGDWGSVAELHNTGLLDLQHLGRDEISLNEVLTNIYNPERLPEGRDAVRIAKFRLRDQFNTGDVPRFVSHGDLIQLTGEPTPVDFERFASGFEPDVGHPANAPANVPAGQLPPPQQQIQLDLDHNHPPVPPEPQGFAEGGRVTNDLTPTPKYPWLATVGEALKGAHEFASKPFGYDNPPGRMASEFLGVHAMSRTAENAAYGMPLTTGSGQTLRMSPDTQTAAFSALPFAQAAGKLAGKAGRALAPTLDEMAYALAQKANPAMYVVKPTTATAQTNVAAANKPLGNLNFRPRITAKNLKGPDVQPISNFLQQTKNVPGVTKEGFNTGTKLSKAFDPTTKVTKQQFVDQLSPSGYSKINLKGLSNVSDDDELIEEAQNMFDESDTFTHLGIPEEYHDDFLGLAAGDLELRDVDPELRKILKNMGVTKVMADSDALDSIDNILDKAHEELADRNLAYLRDELYGEEHAKHGYADVQRLAGVEDEDNIGGYFELGVTHPEHSGLYEHFLQAPETTIGHVRGTFLDDFKNSYAGAENEIYGLPNPKPNSMLIEEIQSDAQKAKGNTGPLHQVHGVLTKAAIQHALENNAQTVYVPTAHTIADIRHTLPETGNFAPIYDQAIHKEALNDIKKMEGVTTTPITDDKGNVLYHEFNFDDNAKHAILNGEGQPTPGYKKGGRVSITHNLEAMRHALMKGR